MMIVDTSEGISLRRVGHAVRNLTDASRRASQVPMRSSSFDSPQHHSSRSKNAQCDVVQGLCVGVRMALLPIRPPWAESVSRRSLAGVTWRWAL
jgi:hypothetical protein